MKRFDLPPARRRLTARTRLTIVFTTLLAAVTVVVAATVYIAMRYLPNYTSFSPAGVTATSQGTDTGTGTGTGTAVAVAVGETLTVRTEGDIFRALLVILLVVTCLVLVLGGAGSYWIAGRTLRPLRRINEAARLAAAGSFSHRLHLPGPLDEITELGLTFDTMLDRLQASFTAHQNFAANASHELQTPLSTTKVILDVALSHSSQTDWPGVVRQLREANERSIGIVDSLLDLTNVDHRALMTEPIDLSPLVAGIISEARRTVEDRGLTIEYQSMRSIVDGDARLLRQLVLNLLGNAIRYNIDAGHIAIRVTDGQPGPTLFISNSGQVIPEAMVERLVEPFVRFEPISAHRDGHGLGLALCSTIVRAHHGSLLLAAGANGGLEVTVSLPRKVQVDI